MNFEFNDEPKTLDSRPAPTDRDLPFAPMGMTTLPEQPLDRCATVETVEPVESYLKNPNPNLPYPSLLKRGTSRITDQIGNKAAPKGVHPPDVPDVFPFPEAAGKLFEGLRGI